jgi:sec-independent protein translocase protein TatA
MPLGPWELIIILLIVVIIFGAGRLSEIGGAFGRSIKEFRNATRDEESAPPVVAPTAPPVVTTTTTALPTDATAHTAQTKCASCGTLNPAERSFCGQCGARLSVPV